MNVGLAGVGETTAGMGLEGAPGQSGTFRGERRRQPLSSDKSTTNARGTPFGRRSSTRPSRPTLEALGWRGLAPARGERESEERDDAERHR